MLHYCQKHGLASVATGVCRQLGMACWSQGRVGDALRWLLQARDEARCTLVVAPLLDKVHAQLLAGAGEYALAELDLPELDDLQALLQVGCQPAALPCVLLPCHVQLYDSVCASVSSAPQ